MIYLCTKQSQLFNSSRYTIVTFEEALNILKPLQLVQLDTETSGLDMFTKKILCIQLGNKENQVVIDWSSLGTYELAKLKEFLESNRLFIGWNLSFDLGFLYVQHIYPNHIYDGMIVEQLLYLGFPAGMHSMSLKSAVWNYCNFDLDKSVRGKIINEGLTEEVIVYAAGDVMYIEDIKEKQEIELQNQNMKIAADLENEFLKCLTYIRYCGVKLDVTKWKEKMKKNSKRLEEAKQKLNEWVVDWSINNPDKSCGASYKLVSPKDKAEIERLQNSKYGRCPEKDVDFYGEIDYIGFKRISGYKYADINYQGDLFEGFNTDPMCNINWSSSKQVIPLFEDLGFKLDTFDKKTKKKKKSVEAKIIKKQLDVSPIAKIYLEYQEASKVVSTYGQNWIDAINPVTGRIHPEYWQLGTDTARISSGKGLAHINIQNLPNDSETRSCFVAESGNKWISADYQSQESRIIASVSGDKAMIDLFEHGSGDVHSLVAKMSYPEIIGDTKIEDIKSKFHKQRQDAKSIEFSINYGGDFNTIANNNGIPIEEAKQIYDNFMKGFPGIKSYQDYCRMAVMRDGYILLNPITGHRAHIYDFEELKAIEAKFSTPGFWAYYNQMKKENPTCDTVLAVKNYFKRKADSEKQSINYRIQNRGAMCFKLFSIKLFNYIKSNNLIDTVKYCIPAHDEANLEAPENIANDIAKILVQCMVSGAKPFCTKVKLGADVEVGDFWIH